MSNDGEEDGAAVGRNELMFVVASAAIFLAIAGCVVYFVARIML